MSVKKIALLLNLQEWQVGNVIKLLQQDASIPFIARYRKEKTGGLDEVDLRNIQQEFERLEELEKRRTFILGQIEELGKLSPELKKLILEAGSSEELEDLYLPYKSRRKTKADVAREAGFEPLAKAIYAQRGDQWVQNWKSLVKDQTVAKEKALQMARNIIAEWISEDTALRARLRGLFEKEGKLVCKVTRGKLNDPGAQKYKDYFNYLESVTKCPSHRFLAMQRGEEESWLKIHVSPEEAAVKQIMKRQCLRGYGESQNQLMIAMADAWDRLLQPGLESEILAKLRLKSDEDAIKVFAENARQLLLSAPLGEKSLLAIDPGFKSGCKLVCLSETGELLHNTTMFPHEPQSEKTKSADTLLKLITDYKPEVIAVGNGTAGRETQDFIKSLPNITLPVYMVNESGASIYSASDVAREEFPDKDLTVRGAVSIGRRLMDPLAELVKIDPKSIGVGQYQHDVNQTLLKKRLETVVESAVNQVGVNLNTASKHLLARVSGLGPVMAKNIVETRNTLGAFQSREQLKKVPRMGEKAFEQCAGFLRIRGAKNPLDNSAVHPERYDLVKRMAGNLGVSIHELLQNTALLEKIQPEAYINEAESLGLLTIRDILNELKKTGLDPRGEFQQVGFSETVRSISDLDAGMELNGIITNIVDFGAFVDIGVKQDGLVHISQMSQNFIKHPNEVVTLGQLVKVRITEVDKVRKRIGLTMRIL
jgi:uncharacterized protein